MTESELLQALADSMKPMADEDGYTKRQLMKLWGRSERMTGNLLHDLGDAGLVRFYKAPRMNRFSELRMTYLYAPVKASATKIDY